MISLIKEIPEISVNSAAYAKICTTAAAYAEYEKIALFWQQTDACGNITALLSLLDSSMTICNINSNFSELCEFIKCINPSVIFTELSTAQKLNLSIGTVCDTLFINPPYDFETASENTYAGFDYAYNIITQRLYVGDKTTFKADILHRINHNCATYVTTPYSAAFLLFGKNCAMLSGIAVTSDAERKGIGSATLKRILLSAREKTLYVCAEEKNTPFYLKNGLKFIEKCAYCRL